MQNINQENVTKFILVELGWDDDCGYPVSRRTLVAILDRICELKPEWKEALNYNEETGWLIAAYEGVFYYGPDDYYTRVMVDYKGNWDWKIFTEEDRKFLTQTAWVVRNEQSELTDNPEWKAAAYELRDKLREVLPDNWYVDIQGRWEFETDDSWGVEWMTHYNGQDCRYSVDWCSWNEIWTYKAWLNRPNIRSIHHKWKMTDKIPDLFELMYDNDGHNVYTNYEIREQAGLPNHIILD